ncbi:MAG: sodium:alanine symporter family protein [Bdellovibrionaceae bacterium]|nr:sodium:alanine symporter family protein [Pseudobdellovibrionaceae bacterium]
MKLKKYLSMVIISLMLVPYSAIIADQNDPVSQEKIEQASKGEGATSGALIIEDKKIPAVEKPTTQATSTEEGLESFFNSINGKWAAVLFWSDHPLQLPFILVVMAFGGIFFTIRYNFINLKLFRHAIDVVRGKFDDPSHKGEVTHFQALTSALSATVGLGNIGGVAVAIALGGPGAVFWLWIVAFFGMSMKFSSVLFAQEYRIVKKDGKILGGPMVYLDRGIGEVRPKLKSLGKVFALIFAFFTICASFGGGNMYQGNQSFELLAAQFPSLADSGLAVGLIMAVFVGIVIIGGIKRIGEVTSKLVPAMCGFYVVCCLLIIFSNLGDVPGLIGSIFKQAFSPDAMWVGGFVGVLTQGVKRASFSNEAGLGSAAIAHAAAKTDKPVREGVVAMIGPFIDTHLVCTMTALAILITGAHTDPSLAGKGAAITAKAFESLGAFMPLLLTFATIIFAYSTMISWSYYGEQSTEYIFGVKAIPVYRMIYVLVVVLGPLLSLSAVIDFSDLALLSMAFPNIIGMILLSGKAKGMVDSYLADFKAGKFKVFAGE